MLEWLRSLLAPEKIFVVLGAHEGDFLGAFRTREGAEAKVEELKRGDAELELPAGDFEWYLIEEARLG